MLFRTFVLFLLDVSNQYTKYLLAALLLFTDLTVFDPIIQTLIVLALVPVVDKLTFTGFVYLHGKEFTAENCEEMAERILTWKSYWPLLNKEIQQNMITEIGKIFIEVGEDARAEG